MLILRRRAGESILIGDSIEIEITEIGPSKVKIGIRAPGDVPILRKEMAAVRERNRCAAQLSTDSRERLAKNLSLLFPQTSQSASDMTFEARYSRHPKTKENLEPA